MSKYPRISIVTPSFNQGEYIEETIQSILDQNYPDLEYIIIDGGSTDGTIDLIKKYEKHLAYWESKSDSGQSDAINRGFNIASGLYGNWINSDDLLEKNALLTVAAYIQQAHEKEIFIGKYIEFNNAEAISKVKKSDIISLEQLIDINKGWRRDGGNQIGQQSTFFPLKLFREVGMLNTSNHNTMDYELWGKFLLAGAQFSHIPEVLSKFRLHEKQKTSDYINTTKSLISTARCLITQNELWNETRKDYFLKKLNKYETKFHYGIFRSRIGLRRRMKFVYHSIKRFFPLFS